MAEEQNAAYRYSYGASYLTMGLLGIVANTMVSISIQKRNPKTSFNAIVASLSLADGISSLLFIVIGVGIILYTGGVVGYEMVQYAVIGLNFSVLASLNHVLLSVLHRAIVAFRKEHLIDNWVVFSLFFILVWGSASLYGIMSVLVIKTFLTMNSVISVVYTGGTVLLYVPVLYQRQKSQGLNTLKGDGIIGRRITKGNELTHSVLLTICSSVSYLPFAIAILTSNTGAIEGFICDMLIAMNPFMDAIIYFYVNSKEKHTRTASKGASEPLVPITAI